MLSRFQISELSKAHQITTHSENGFLISVSCENFVDKINTKENEWNIT